MNSFEGIMLNSRTYLMDLRKKNS